MAADLWGDLLAAATLVTLAGIALLYACGVARAWRSAGVGHGVSWIAAASFLAGSITLVLALVTLHEWTETRFAAHMLQHELLMVVAAPLWAAADAPIAFAWLAPRRLWRPVAALRRASRWPSVPGAALASLTHALALWAWHIPALFDAARANDGIHALQHLSFFATALWFWRSLSHGPLYRVGFGSAVLYLFGTSVQSGALGALMVFSPAIWYAPGSAIASPIDALHDQQLAGLLMWIPASVIFLAAGLLYLAAWLRESERRGATGLSHV